MAGNYADVPGPRMAYHRDGTVGFQIVSGSLSALSGANLQTINNESTDSLGSYGRPGPDVIIGVVFPELRDIVGYFIQSLGGMTFTDIQWSTNTTNGQDGTWTALSGENLSYQQAQVAGVAVPSRTDIRTTAMPLNGAKAFRVHMNDAADEVYLTSLHLYGKPSSGETRFLTLTNTSDVELTGAYFDFADDPRNNATEDKVFRVKNVHPTLTANSIDVSFNVLTDKSPSFADDYTFSTGGSFAATQNIGNLAPGASSSDITVRRQTPTNAQLGLETGFILAAAGSWT